MGDRDAGIGRNRDGRRDARNDLEGNPGLGHRLGFFSAPAEHKGIAALQPDHGLTGARLFDHQAVDVFLGTVLPAPPTSHIDTLRLRTRVVQQRRVGQVVIEHHIGLLQAFLPAQGQQFRVSRPRTDKIDRSRLHGAVP